MLRIAEPILQARAARLPIVALESTVISHGLPYPQNLELALALEAEVRANGAIPATIAVLGGVPTVGLTEAEIEHFAQPNQAIRKLSRRDVAAAIADRVDGATTVAATMAFARAAQISVFATGGIGGVHRGAERTWDISADLTELARTPVLVVCAGAKAILDLPATLEQLETLGVPVVGLGTDEFPAFYSLSSGLPVPVRAEDSAHAARIWLAQRRHYAYSSPGGMLVCAPPPAEVALPRDEIEAHIATALAHAERSGVRGPAVTPFLLRTMAEVTSGESITTNTALLRNNARLASLIAQQIELFDTQQTS